MKGRARREVAPCRREIATSATSRARRRIRALYLRTVRDSRPCDDRTARLLGLAAILAGCYAAWFYHQAGLTLSHYDAKAHLVVARRVIDSLTPGWKQIGAVWLPLPHLLNLLPVQVDVFYRTGAFAVGMSRSSAFGLMVYACARLVLQVTGSRTRGGGRRRWSSALNPDMLYLQATPMTEPLLLALTTLRHRAAGPVGGLRTPAPSGTRPGS